MDHFILEIPNVLSPEICNSIIERFENDKEKVKGRIAYGGSGFKVMENMKNTTEVLLTGRNEWKDVDSILNECINCNLKKYLTFLKNTIDAEQEIHPLSNIPFITETDDVGYSIQKTTKGCRYAWHYDGGIGANDFANILIYLNTLDYDEGGCTKFINGRKVKPEAGKMLIFPSTWNFVHSGCEVKGVHPKYTCIANTKVRV